MSKPLAGHTFFEPVGAPTHTGAQSPFPLGGNGWTVVCECGVCHYQRTGYNPFEAMKAAREERLILAIEGLTAALEKRRSHE